MQILREMSESEGSLVSFREVSVVVCQNVHVAREDVKITEKVCFSLWISSERTEICGVFVRFVLWQDSVNTSHAEVLLSF